MVSYRIPEQSPLSHMNMVWYAPKPNSKHNGRFCRQEKSRGLCLLDCMCLLCCLTGQWLRGQGGAERRFAAKDPQELLQDSKLGVEA